MGSPRSAGARALSVVSSPPEAEPQPANEQARARPSGIRFADPRREADPVDRVELAVLLHQKRFEEALGLLLEAQREAPEDEAIERGILAIREHLVKRFVRWAGGLDRVLVPAQEPEREIGRSPRFAHVLELVGEGATLGDILAESRFSRHETIRLLSALMRLCVIGIVQPAR